MRLLVWRVVNNPGGGGGGGDSHMKYKDAQVSSHAFLIRRTQNSPLSPILNSVPRDYDLSDIICGKLKTVVFTIHLLPESGRKGGEQYFFRPRRLFSSFPPMRSLVPGYVYSGTLNI